MQLDEKRQVEIKLALGKQAADLVEEKMTVGLGSGTTATHFIHSLIDRVRAGLQIRAVASSEASLKIAAQGGIPIVNLNEVDQIDLTVDGADEVDPKFRMIKGKGGALVREKILAAASRSVLILVDASKLVDRLGKRGLPVEILPFGYRQTILHLEKVGFTGTVRHSGAKPYLTDNGNFIIDLDSPFDDPEKAQITLLNIAGVIDTGFFFNLANRLMIGYADGKIEIKKTR